MLSPLNFHLNAMNYLHFEMLDKTLALYPCVGNNIGVPRAGPRAASRAFFFQILRPHSTPHSARRGQWGHSNQALLSLTEMS